MSDIPMNNNNNANIDISSRNKNKYDDADDTHCEDLHHNHDEAIERRDAYFAARADRARDQNMAWEEKVDEIQSRRNSDVIKTVDAANENIRGVVVTNASASPTAAAAACDTCDSAIRRRTHKEALHRKEEHLQEMVDRVRDIE